MQQSARCAGAAGWLIALGSSPDRVLGPGKSHQGARHDLGVVEAVDRDSAHPVAVALLVDDLPLVKFVQSLCALQLIEIVSVIADVAELAVLQDLAWSDLAVVIERGEFLYRVTRTQELLLLLDRRHVGVDHGMQGPYGPMPDALLVCTLLVGLGLLNPV